MRKNLLFSMAVAVVLCFAVVTATILTGCGNKSSINTVNIYSETPKYEVGNITDHTANLEGVEFLYVQPSGNLESSEGSPYLLFDKNAPTIYNAVDASDNGAVVVKKIVDGVQKYGVYSFKLGKFIFELKECTNLKIMAETESGATYVSYRTNVGEVEKYFVEECGVGIVYEKEVSTFVSFYVKMLGSVVDGKTSYEMWQVFENGVAYYELHKIKSGKRSLVYETRVDAGDPIWLGGVSPIAEDSENLTLENMYTFVGYTIPNGGAMRIQVYNMKKQKNVGSVDISVDVNCLIAIGNTMIFQRVIKLPQNATNYDFIDDRGDLYLLETKMVNLVTAKVTELKDFNYVIQSSDEEYNKEYAVVKASKIDENKMCNSEESAFSQIQINENGKVKEIGIYNKATKLCDDRFVLESSEDMHVLVDGDYDIIAELSGLTDLRFEAVGEMIVAKNSAGKYGVIDKDGKCIVDFKYNDVFCVGNGVVMLSENKTVGEVESTHIYSIDNEGTATELYSYSSNDGKGMFKGSEIAGLVRGTNAFAVKTVDNGKNVYTCYNAKGEQIGVVTDAVDSGNVFNIVNYGKNNENIAFVVVANSGTANAKIVSISTWTNNSLEK